MTSPFLSRALEEADYLRSRILNLQQTVEDRSDPIAEAELLHTIYAMIEKEQLIYTRLLLMDTAQAQQQIECLDGMKAKSLMPVDMGLLDFYIAVKHEIKQILSDVTGEVFDDEEEFDDYEPQ
tara:strand:- start:484 stop:852 length:369 start_codon:yes stop_codon:yes gene_type:complete